VPEFFSGLGIVPEIDSGLIMVPEFFSGLAVVPEVGSGLRVLPGSLSGFDGAGKADSAALGTGASNIISRVCWLRIFFSCWLLKSAAR